MFIKIFYLLALAAFVAPSLAATPYSELRARDLELTRRKVLAINSYCNIFPEGDICNQAAIRPSVSERAVDEFSGAIMKRLDGLIASNCASLPEHLRVALAAKGHCRQTQDTLPLPVTQQTGSIAS
ncbi:hypothetical protein QCA50_004481 [Cerrena zonata]|uniref:UrcA family protein n=1 Tax=Cerrena zonata TaxID=2478898 RepID=A0AAW0GJL2_9APHY